jgi:hypothetical protein
LTCSGINALPSFTRQCVFDYECFIFLGRVTSPSAKPPFLEDQFVFPSLASHLRPARLGRPYQEHKVPAGIACKVIEARKPPTMARWRHPNHLLSVLGIIKVGCFHLLAVSCLLMLGSFEATTVAQWTQCSP